MNLTIINSQWQFKIQSMCPLMWWLSSLPLLLCMSRCTSSGLHPRSSIPWSCRNCSCSCSLWPCCRPNSCDCCCSCCETLTCCYFFLASTRAPGCSHKIWCFWFISIMMFSIVEQHWERIAVGKCQTKKLVSNFVGQRHAKLCLVEVCQWLTGMALHTNKIIATGGGQANPYLLRNLKHRIKL